MVITGLTRNQLGSNPPRVRISPSPPNKRKLCRKVWFPFYFSVVRFEKTGSACRIATFQRTVAKVVCVSAKDLSFVERISPSPPIKKEVVPKGMASFLFSVTF